MAVKRIWPDVAIPPGETLAVGVSALFWLRLEAAYQLNRARLARRRSRPRRASAVA